MSLDRIGRESEGDSVSRKISSERKVLYYSGTLLQIVGGLLFASVFVSAALHFGDFQDFVGQGRSAMLRAFGGMGLIIAGAFLRRIGARGLAGSGIMLDPERARGELEPFTRMGGGMVMDVLEEADVHLGEKPEKVVMIKCPACGKLNEEDSKFCQECGRKI